MKAVDSDREFLITKLVCAQCGRILKLSYPEGRKSIPSVDGEPTGSDKVEMAVHVWPCETCYAPVERVKFALSELVGIAMPEVRS